MCSNGFTWISLGKTVCTTVTFCKPVTLYSHSLVRPLIILLIACIPSIWNMKRNSSLAFTKKTSLKQLVRFQAGCTHGQFLKLSETESNTLISIYTRLIKKTYKERSNKRRPKLLFKEFISIDIFSISNFSLHPSTRVTNQMVGYIINEKISSYA